MHREDAKLEEIIDDFLEFADHHFYEKSDKKIFYSNKKTYAYKKAFF